MPSQKEKGRKGSIGKGLVRKGQGMNVLFTPNIQHWKGSVMKGYWLNKPP